MIANRLLYIRLNAAIVAAALLFAASFTLLATAAAKQSPADNPAGAPSDRKVEPAKSTAGQIEGHLTGGRWREGTKMVDIGGQFRVTGDRVTFFSVDGKSRFACLENLNSERIARMVSESPDSLEWVIQGTITEFRQENYLLVTQAVLRTRQTGGAAGRAASEPESPDPAGT